MPNSDNSPDGNLRAALEVYVIHLHQEHGQPRVGFAKLCAEHPLLADDLRRLHALVTSAQSLTGSTTFLHSLGDVFGEEAEVTLALDETEKSPVDNAATVLEPAVSTTIDFRVPDRYVLEGEVARGGMGVIYRVRDRELNRTLAMKVILGMPPTEADRPSHPLLIRFLEEVQVTAQLDHPGIVAVHELGVDSTGRPYFTMKLVKGHDLNFIFELARTEQDAWNLPRAIGALIKACQAVAFGHLKGVVHRDLKPANIMVGRFGEVYVMDWGLAKVTGRKDLHDIRLAPMSQIAMTRIQTPRGTRDTSNDSPIITMDGSVVGTPAYMPPEQAQGQIGEVDARSDIYSLGAILYSLLTGQAPYVEPGARISPHTILGMVIQGPPKRVHTLNPVVPSELAAICEKAMAREQKYRYQSCLDLAEDLQAWLDHRVVKAYRTGAAAEFKSWVVRNQAAALATAAALFTLLAGLTVVLIKNAEVEEKNRQVIAERQEVIRQRNTAQQSLYDSLLRHARATRQARPVGFRDEVFELLRTAGGLEVTNKSLHDLRREAVACLGDFVGVTPSTVTDFPQDTLITLTRVDPRGQVAAFLLSDGSILLHEVATGKEVARLRGEHRAINICFNAIGDQLTSVHRPYAPPSQARIAEATVQTWKRTMDDRWREIDKVPILGAFACLTCAKGEFVAVNEVSSHSLNLVDLRTRSVVHSRQYHQVMPEELANALSPDGDLLASESIEPPENVSMLELWDLKTRTRVQRFELRLGKLLAASFSADGKHLACLSEIGGVIYAKEGTQRVAEFREYFQPPSQIVFAPGSTVVGLPIYQQNRVRLWDWVASEDLAVLDEPASVFEVNFTADGRSLFTSGRRHTRLYRLHRETEKLSLSGHVGGVPCVAFSPDNSRIASVGKDQSMILWNASTGQKVWSVELGAVGQCVAYRPDGRLLVTTDYYTQLVAIWDAESGRRLGELGTNAPGRIWSAQFSPDGQYLATADGNPIGGISVWALSPSGPEQPPRSPGARLIKSFQGQFWSLVFAPDGRHLGFVRRNDSSGAYVCDITTELQPRLLETEVMDTLQVLSFTADSRELLMAGKSRTIVTANVATGKQGVPFATIDPKKTREWTGVANICLTPDGTKLAVASASGRGVDIWEPKSGRPLISLPEQKGTVWWLAWSTDSQRLAVSRSNGDITIWSLQEIERVLTALKLSP